MSAKFWGGLLCGVLILVGAWRFQVAASVNPPGEDKADRQNEAVDENQVAAVSATPVSTANDQVKRTKWKVSEQSPDEDSMLSRFVDECVEILPGSLVIARDESDVLLPELLVVEHSYRVCRFETTQELYQVVMGVNPSRWQGPRNSVEQITYSDAVQFCEKLTSILLSRQLIEVTDIVRLPTDMEWEYACRAGATTKYCFGDLPESEDGEPLLDAYAWHTGNAAGNDPSVGMLKPNQWQLADVHGYLWEFTQAASSAGDAEVSGVRIWGGSWRVSPLECGCASVREVSASLKAPDLGFRCVISRKVDVKNAVRQ